MADETPTPEAAKKKSPLRNILLVVAILLIEAGAFIGWMMLHKPEPVEANRGVAIIEVPDDEKIVELMVIDARLPNNKAGVTYLYDAQIWVQVKNRYSTQVSDQLDRFRNEIKAEITAIWRTSDPRHFQEPKLENLTRKINALLDARLGSDPQTGETILAKSVSVMQPGFRIDS